MNKETRTFIWGVLLLIVCGSSFAGQVVEMVNGVWKFSALHVLYFLLMAHGTIGGAVRICRTTD